jgi:predicted metal-dependent phosphoesterase TrpH
MYLKGDFHMHTTASDGKLSPEILIQRAVNSGLDIIAVTDHDTIDAIDKCISEGEKNNIKVIPGVELTTVHNGESIHLLGYFIGDSYKNPEVKEFLCSIKNHRETRAKKIIKNLDTHFNIKIEYEDVLKKAKGIVARPHIAQAIIDSGYAKDFNYIFTHILSEDSPAFVPNKKITVQEGIDFLKSYNALVVLAHPVLIKDTPIDEMVQFNFDGMEAIYPLNSEEDTKLYVNIARNNNKFITCGSDFHGIENDPKHGNIGSLPLEGELLKEFLSKLKIGC